MKTKLLSLIRNIDSFGVPINLSLRDNGHTFRSPEGGICTLILGVFVLWQSISHFSLMIFYGNDQIQVNESLMQFETLGIVDIKDMVSMAMYPIKYKGHFLPKHHEKKCMGSCEAFVEQSLDIYWEQSIEDGFNKTKVRIF